MIPPISPILEILLKDHRKLGIQLFPAMTDAIEHFESVTGLQLPDDFRTFYSIFSELNSKKEEFRIMPLPEILENEYFSDKGLFFGTMPDYYELWRVVIDKDDRNNYMILTKEGDITPSLADFLERFMTQGSAGIFPTDSTKC